MALGRNIILIERMLIREKTQEDVLILRIVKVLPHQVWVCNINDDSWPYPMPSQLLTEELNSEGSTFSLEPIDPWARPFAVSTNETQSIPPSSVLHQKRWNMLQEIVFDENATQILVKSGRQELIVRICACYKISRQTASGLLKQFWKRGMTFDSLRPDYNNCGKRRDGGPRDLKDKKVGAPRTITPGTGINVTSEIRRILQVGADFYLSRSKPSLKEAHDYIVELYYSVKVKAGKETVGIAVTQDEKPTERQLKYFIQNNYTDGYRTRRRNGQKNWDLNERELLGTADGDVQGPGDRFQIDATVADVYLRSQFDRRRIVGRPVIYFVIDVFSRLIVGVYVGFEGPSWVGAMMALINMVTPKIEFCRSYGIPIEESDWPSHYAPSKILADRGELMSVDLGHKTIKNLTIDIENTSSGRGDLKAIVERRFGVVPSKYKQFTPGYIEKDFGKRGTKDYRLEATYNLKEFTHQVILAVLEHNFSPIRDLRIPAEMVTEELTSAPLDLWHWGIKNRSGLLKMLTIEQVSLQVMPSEKAQVTVHGIKFHKGFYSCPTALRDGWFSKARHKEWEVDVSFDPRSLDLVYVTDKNNPHWYEPCRLLEPSKDYIGKSLFELEELDLAKARTEAAGENSRQEKRILYNIRKRNMKKKAKAETKAVVDSSLTKSQQTSGIGTNRASEKEHHRNTETIVFPESSMDVSDEPSVTYDANYSNVNPDSNKPNMLEILKRKREERRDKSNG